ncbi:MAG: hypothetical protein V4494_02725 [Chlamydiota bacterium]
MSNIINNPNYVLNIQTQDHNFAIHADNKKEGLCGHHQKTLHNAIHSLAINYINSENFTAWRREEGLTQEADARIKFKENKVILTIGSKKFKFIDNRSKTPTIIVKETNRIYQECMAHRKKYSHADQPIKAHEYTSVKPQSPSMNPFYSDNNAYDPMSQLPSPPNAAYESKVLSNLNNADKFFEFLDLPATPSEEHMIEHNASIGLQHPQLMEILNSSAPEIPQEIQSQIEYLEQFIQIPNLDSDLINQINQRIHLLKAALGVNQALNQEADQLQEHVGMINNLDNAVNNVHNNLGNLLNIVKNNSPPVSPPQSPKHAEEKHENIVNPEIQNINNVAQALNDPKSKASFVIPPKHTDAVHANKHLLASNHPDPISELANNSNVKISHRARTGLHGLNEKIANRKKQIQPASLIIDLQKDIDLFNDILIKVPNIQKNLTSADATEQKKAFESLLELLSPNQNPWIAIALLDDEYRIDQALKQQISKKTHADLLKNQLTILQLKKEFGNLYRAIELSPPGRRGTVRNGVLLPSSQKHTSFKS